MSHIAIGRHLLHGYTMNRAIFILSLEGIVFLKSAIPVLPLSGILSKSI